jgi:hypothetical protein
MNLNLHVAVVQAIYEVKTQTMKIAADPSRLWTLQNQELGQASLTPASRPTRSL